MAAHQLPTVGKRYVDGSGEAFEVIGLGTGGIVIEYLDGRAKLIDLQSWRDYAEEGTDEVATASPY